jgi:hypothetical protein
VALHDPAGAQPVLGVRASDGTSPHVARASAISTLQANVETVLGEIVRNGYERPIKLLETILSLRGGAAGAMRHRGREGLLAL